MAEVTRQSQEVREFNDSVTVDVTFLVGIDHQVEVARQGQEVRELDNAVSVKVTQQIVSWSTSWRWWTTRTVGNRSVCSLTVGQCVTEGEVTNSAFSEDGSDVLRSTFVEQNRVRQGNLCDCRIRWIGDIPSLADLAKAVVVDRSTFGGDREAGQLEVGE